MERCHGKNTVRYWR